MLLKINDVEIAAYPKDFTVTVLDLDNDESTERTADGTLSRDRVTVKRQIEMSWNAIPWASVSALLTAMQDVFFDFYYPDPMTGQYETKKFYVGNRPAPVAVENNGVLYWAGLKVTLTEQ